MFKPIPGYEGLYEINECGDVARGPNHRFKRPGILKWGRNRFNVAHVSLSKPGHKKLTLSVHRLVWRAFRGPIPKHLTINHIDGNRGNNRLDNLELATMPEQMRHALALGLLIPTRGEDRGRVAKMNNQSVREVRRLRQEGIRVVELAQRYSVSVECIYQILSRKNWAHID